jgi:hypothetical protein
VEEPPRLPTLSPDAWESGNRKEDGNGHVTKDDWAVSFRSGLRSAARAEELETRF